MAINLQTGDTSAFVVVDRGPSKASLGEISVKLAEQLGGSEVNPRNGKGLPKGEILYVVFPYSAKEYPWPLSVIQLQDSVAAKMTAIGCVDSIKACVTF